MKTFLTLVGNVVFWGWLGYAIYTHNWLLVVSVITVMLAGIVIGILTSLNNK